MIFTDDKKLTRKEFIKICQTAGYCKKQTAEKYAAENKGREMTVEQAIERLIFDNLHSTMESEVE